MDEDQKAELAIRSERLNGQFDLLRTLEPSARVWAVSCMNVLTGICLSEDDPKSCFDTLMGILKRYFDNCQSKEDSD
jgi:hypothetical protein